jgi:hypothetical protein
MWQDSTSGCVLPTSKLITLSEGEVDELHIGLKGTMNALFLRDLAAKIKRGQSGRIASGLSAGGSYGYRVTKKLDDRGEPMRGLRELDEDQANVVRRGSFTNMPRATLRAPLRLG